MARTRTIRIVKVRASMDNLSPEEKIVKSLMELHDINFKDAQRMQRMREMTRELSMIA